MNCADVYRIFFNPGEVTEIRAIGASGKNKSWEGWARNIVSGFFDNADDFGKAAEALDEAKPKGIYFVLNPVHSDLLARAKNRLKVAAEGEITSDKHVLCLRWLYIDVDIERDVKGISAKSDELAQATELRNKISRWLKDRGFGQGIPAMSGNGAHLLCRLPDLANTPENANLLKSTLEAIQAKWGTPQLAIDMKVFNPARICKLYGTWARKGDHTDERPHRLSYIEPKLESVLKGQNNDSSNP